MSTAAEPTRSFELMMFAEHYQFYVYDRSADPGELSVYWDDEARDNMILIRDNIIAIGTARHLEVPVHLDIYEKEPKEEPLDDYDHVIQCGLDLESGVLVLSGATEDYYPAEKIEFDPGLYGVRVYYGALAEIDEEGFEGEDFYRVSLWKTETRPELSILKQWHDRPKMMY